MSVKRIFSLAEARQYGLRESAVNKAIDTETKKIVGWVGGATFGGEACADGIKEFHLLCPPAAFGDHVFRLHGTTLSAALIALGVGHDYEETYGDHRGLIEMLKKNPEDVYVYRVDYVRLPQDEVDNALGIALGRQT